MEEDRSYDEYARAKTEDIIKSFSGSLDGLSEEEVLSSREKYGSNKIEYENDDSIIKKIIKSFITPFTIVLLILASVSYTTNYALVNSENKSIATVVIILVMILLSGFVSFIQSIRSSNASDKLQSMFISKANVIRKEVGVTKINTDDLVCGDIVKLNAGDLISADIRLIETKDLLISQSVLTGESHAVEKNSLPLNEDVDTKNIIDYKNLVFMGSNVSSGYAKGIVIKTGSQSQFGKIAKGVSDIDSHTNFEKGVNSVSWLLIRFMITMVPIVFLINGVSKGNWLDAGLFALSIAIGLTPEMLPMAITANLVKGTMAMAKKGTIIKNIGSIQNFGALDILCTDKTGTLTDDNIVLEHYLDINGIQSNSLLKLAYLNSQFQDGLENLMDKSIIDVANDISISSYSKIDELPFDFERRRLSVLVNDGESSILITKGAVEEVIACCTKINNNNIIEDFDNCTHLKLVDDLNSKGYRVIAVASKQINESEKINISDESNMILQGYLAFIDPPKKSAKLAISSLKDNNVTLKVLTGDNELVSKTVCREVGLNAENVIFGYQIEKVSGEELNKIIRENDVFVKLSPQQKAKIVTSFKDNGHVVGFMGDGVNDALAMKKADVGISVDTAVDIAKEAADIILTEKDLLILNTGILAGRHIFGNIMKYIKMTVSSNFGNIFSVLIASIFLPFLPMLPIQLLILNLIYDLSATSLPWDNVDREYLAKPRKWDSKSISKFMIRIGPISSIFDISTYLIMYFIICPLVFNGSFHTLNSVQQIGFIALFNAGWFVESLWSQTLVIHALRTEKIPILQSRASLIVTIVTGCGIAFGTLLPFTSIGSSLGMVPLPLIYFVYLVTTITLYMLAITIAKKLYIKKYGELI